MELKVKSWKDVTIEMYQELSNIESGNDISVIINKISILVDTDQEEIRNLPVPEFRKLTEDISWVANDPTKEVKIKFEIDGKKYGMIPDLNFITTGEWADIEAWKDESNENLHLIAALLYRPITKEDGDEYEIEPHKTQGFMKRADLFKQRLTIDQMWGSLLFFSASGLKFIEITADYLEEEAKVATRKAKRAAAYKKKKMTTQKATKKSK